MGTYQQIQKPTSQPAQVSPPTHLQKKPPAITQGSGQTLEEMREMYSRFRAMGDTCILSKLSPPPDPTIQTDREEQETDTTTEEVAKKINSPPTPETSGTSNNSQLQAIPTPLNSPSLQRQCLDCEAEEEEENELETANLVLECVMEILQGSSVAEVQQAHPQAGNLPQEYQNAFWDFFKGVQGIEYQSGQRVEASSSRRRFWIQAGMRRIDSLLNLVTSQEGEEAVMAERIESEIHEPVRRILASTVDGEFAGRDEFREIIRETRGEFGIPARGWQHEQTVRGEERTRTLTLGTSRSSLPQGIIRDLNTTPGAIEHIQETLELFQSEEEEGIHLDREEIDLPLLLAIAARESGDRNRHLLFSSDSEEEVISAGSDAHRSGRSGLDWLGSRIDEFPSAIRGDITRVRGSRYAAGLIADRDRDRDGDIDAEDVVDPARLPPEHLLAGFIVELQARQRRFVRVFHEVFSDRQLTAFSEDERQRLLESLSTDARRAWIQASFGSALNSLLWNAKRATAVRGLGRAATRESRGERFAEIIGDDRYNLNSIISDRRVMGSSISGHRTRITAAEAAILEQILPPSLQ